MTEEEPITQEEWVEQGKHLARDSSDYQWRLGDWWNCGLQWGEGKAVCAELGITYPTARDCGAVAAAFQLSRRRDNLTFTHHREVCALDAAEQDRLLDWCLETPGRPRSTLTLREAVRTIRVEDEGTMKNASTRSKKKGDEKKRNTGRQSPPQGTLLEEGPDAHLEALKLHWHCATEEQRQRFKQWIINYEYVRRSQHERMFDFHLVTEQPIHQPVDTSVQYN